MFIAFMTATFATASLGSYDSATSARAGKCDGEDPDCHGDTHLLQLDATTQAPATTQAAHDAPPKMKKTLTHLLQSQTSLGEYCNKTRDDGVIIGYKVPVLLNRLKEDMTPMLEKTLRGTIADGNGGVIQARSEDMLDEMREACLPAVAFIDELFAGNMTAFGVTITAFDERDNPLSGTIYAEKKMSKCYKFNITPWLLQEETVTQKRAWELETEYVIELMGVEPHSVEDAVEAQFRALMESCFTLYN